MRNSAAYECFARLLRGRHASIRDRIDSYRLGYYKMRGRRWTDFYARYVDRQTTTNDNTSQEYFDRGQQHLQFLESVGLRPDHRFLDYGCGYMRTGFYLIPYLQGGKYVGVDISPERIAMARNLAQEKGFDGEQYELHLLDGLNLAPVDDQRFDFVWAQSVFTHMEYSDIALAMKQIRHVLEDGGVFMFTFAPAEIQKTESIKDFWYPPEDMEKLSVQAGFEFDIVPGGEKVFPLNLVGRAVAPAAP